MAVTNLETASRVHPNSPRDLYDASELSQSAGAQADATLGAQFANTGSEVLVIAAFKDGGTNDTDQVFHLLRQDSTVPSGLAASDAASGSNTYDVFTVTTKQICVIGPLNPARYNDASGLVTLIDATVASDQGLHTIVVCDLKSRRSARSSVTR